MKLNNVGVSVPYKVIATFGPDPMRGNGKDEVRYYCPECVNRRGTPDTKGKLYVNIRSLKYNCFLCGYSGQIGRHFHVNESRVYNEDQDIEVESLIKNVSQINGESNKFDLKIPIDKIFTSDSAVQYLLNRGFSEDQLEYYDMRVGNLDEEFGRVVIPNQVDHIVYTDFYSARTFIDQSPKYHNPCKDKSNIVFNLFRQKEGDPIIVVEGALTAVAASKHAVATLGKTMTKSQAGQILSKRPCCIYVNYDYGAEKYSHDACKLLYSINPDIPIYEVLMDSDRDAADMSTNEYVACLKRAKQFSPLIEDLVCLI